MGAMVQRFFGILGIVAVCLGSLIEPGYATPPGIVLDESFDERGEFYSIFLVDEDTLTPSLYMSGVGLQALFQAYVVKLDVDGELVWARSWGSTNHMVDCVWRNGVGAMFGYTTENATNDYKILEFTGEGSLQDSWDFGGNTTGDRGMGGAFYDSANYLIVGSISPGASASTDGSLVLVTASGDVEWSRTFPSSAAVRRVARTDSATIWLYGTADTTAERNTDFWMARSDSLGQLQDSFRFGAAQGEELYDAIRISEELTILVGATRSFADSTQTDIWLFATNDSGDSLWSGFFGGTENDAALCVKSVSDRDSGFVIAGYWSEELLGTRNAYLMKFDQNFDSVWAIVLTDTLNASEFRDVVLDGAHRYHAAGVRYSPIPHGYHVVTDVDPAAPVQHAPDPFTLISPGDSSFFVVDTIRFTWQATTDPDPGDQVAYALLFDSDTLFDDPLAFGPLPGTSFLVNRNDDIFDRYWRVVAQDQNNNLTICTDQHRHVRKISPDSTQAFSLLTPDSGSTLVSPSGLFSWQVALDPDSLDENIFYDLYFQVGDSVTVIDTIATNFVNVNFVDHPFINQSDTIHWWVVVNSDYPEMQLPSRQTWSFINWNVPADETPPAPQKFALNPAYPNPFNASVTLEYSIRQAAETELSVYDVAGRLVTTLVSGSQTPGLHSVRWDGQVNGTQVATGLYFARLIAGNNVATQKLLLMK